MNFYKLPLDRKVGISEITLNHPPPGHGKIPDAGSGWDRSKVEKNLAAD